MKTRHKMDPGTRFCHKNTSQIPQNFRLRRAVAVQSHVHGNAFSIDCNSILMAEVRFDWYWEICREVLSTIDQL